MKTKSLTKKIIAGFLTIILLMVILGTVSYRAFIRIESLAQQLTQVLSTDMYMDESIGAHRKWMNELNQTLLLGQKFQGRLEPSQCSFGQWYSSFRPTDPKTMSIYQKIGLIHTALHESVKEVLRLHKSGDKKEALKVYTSQTLPDMEKLQGMVNQMSTELMGQIAKLEKEYHRVAKRSKNFIIYTIIVTLLLAALCSSLIPLKLTRPIRRLTQFANRITAGGDLSETIRIKNQDEIGQLASSFNLMIQSLQKSRAELQEWGDTLEKKVESRTRDLKEAYQQLETTQAQLVQSSKLASIGELAAGMAHEINNPMNVMMGYAELLLDEIEHGTQAHTYIMGMLEAGQRISSIIKNLLNFARQGKQECSNVYIPELIDQALSFMQKRLEKENIRIKRNYEPDLPLLCVQSGQLEQVFLNLIINAKDALLQKSKNGIKGTFEKLIQIGVQKIQGNSSEIIRITFRDTGTGIKPENLSRVFDPFFTTKRADKGTGLGLSISYGIIKDQRGSIGVESREGEFTAFIIDLPTDRATSRSLRRKKDERCFVS